MHLSTRQILVATTVAALLSVTTTLTGNWLLATVTGVPFYLVLPGYLFQLAFRPRLNLSVPVFVYAVGLSLLTWLLGGLAINTLLPLVQIMKPLQLSYLIGLYLSVIIALCTAIKLRGAEVYCTYAARHSDLLAILAAFILPVLSVIGSTVLNNGGTGTVSIVMLVLASLYILVLSFGHRHFSQSAYVGALYGLSVSLLLMYSLRSWHVLGWDVHQEMEVFSATLAHERWGMSYFPGLDYNACLSITILPTVLVKLLRITPEYIFKFVFQLIFAVTPVAIYATARRYFHSSHGLFSRSTLYLADLVFRVNAGFEPPRDSDSVFCAVPVRIDRQYIFSQCTSRHALLVQPGPRAQSLFHRVPLANHVYHRRHLSLGNASVRAGCPAR